MSEWQEIESAPKDGTRIDLWVKFDGEEPRRVADAYWSCALWNRKTEGHWWAPNHCYDGEDGWLIGQPSHWMPVPPPPSDPGIPVYRLKDGTDEVTGS